MKDSHKTIVDSIRSEATISRLYNLAIEGLEIGADGWYAEGLEEVKALAKSIGGTVADWSLLLSVYSPRCSVSRAARMALSHYLEPDVKPSGAMAQIYRTAVKYRPLGYLNGQKTENFRRAILTGGNDNENSDFVFDTHMAKAFEVDQSIGYRKWCHGSMIETLNDVSKMLVDNLGVSLTVDQLQATIWGGQLIASGLDVSKRNLIPEDVSDFAKSYGVTV